ncbi:MAG: S-layer homology domain-containing protein, partial [Acidimicrobiaceae bacterium]|nr:S-layer homology domain-containing protein [Acidimicrobiaceae bacterium]
MGSGPALRVVRRDRSSGRSGRSTLVRVLRPARCPTILGPRPRQPGAGRGVIRGGRRRPRPGSDDCAGDRRPSCGRLGPCGGDRRRGRVGPGVLHRAARGARRADYAWCRHPVPGRVIPGHQVRSHARLGSAPVSRKLVERVSRVVDRRAGRRGFLRSSAMAATAVAVAPVAYAIRPTTAEAAIVHCQRNRCRSSALCCDPYTEFCCKLTGENLCPPGTVVAGWWKVDGSGFCDLNGPSPRYYLDCNFTCHESCSCRWSDGTCARGCTPAFCDCRGGCDTRKSECTRFRYGQCNQDVCVGPLKCRIVTCVPPWTWDPACATSPVLYDPGTRWHDRPCLHDGFNDVPPRAYYAEAVEWMADEGITTGMKDDLFGPDEPVNRAQFATFLWRYEGRPRVEPSNKFNDVPEDAFYSQAVAWMVEQRITTGR